MPHNVISNTLVLKTLIWLPEIDKISELPGIILVVVIVEVPTVVESLKLAKQTASYDVSTNDPIGPVSPLSPFGPVGPLSPLSPLGITKSKTWWLPTALSKAKASLLSSPVLVLPTSIVAVYPEGPAEIDIPLHILVVLSHIIRLGPTI